MNNKITENRIQLEFLCHKITKCAVTFASGLAALAGFGRTRSGNG